MTSLLPTRLWARLQSWNDGCRIVRSKISDAVLMADSTVQDSQLHDSIVGERAVIEGSVGGVSLSDDSWMIINQ